VALGLALDASERFPELTDNILPVATFGFEVVGTLFTQLALSRAEPSTAEPRAKR
jgi:hypothetical protein